MKKNLPLIFSVILAVFAFSSCEGFLNRPAEDTYNRDNFYQTDEQCIQGVNYLYNSPWFDVIRGFYRVGECFSGNYYMGSSPYLQFTVNGSDKELRDMSSSLWSVNAHASTVYNRTKEAEVSESVKNMVMGEALTWKAFAYFFLVRSFGEVPIIHDISQAIAAGDYNDLYKAPKEDVYQYTVMLLEEAMKLLMVGESRDQIVLKTSKAAASLKFISAEVLSKEQIENNRRQHEADNEKYQEEFAKAMQEQL